jgi:transposase
MMGRRNRDQGKLFYEFRLEDRIPPNHLLRRINVFITAALDDLHEVLEPYYSEIGRPSVDPELMIAYRWFCKLDLDDAIPHHSTFSANRLGRFRESDVLRHIFERVVWSAMAMGLVKGEGFAVDASVLEANASRYHGKPPEELDWTEQQRQKRAVAEYIAALDVAAQTIEEGHGKDGEGDGPETPRQRRSERKAPKVISPSDPSSAWTAKANKRVQFGYGLNYLIDIENAVIVDVEATPARTYDEVAATKTMIDRTEQCFDLKPKRLAADTAYGTGKFLGWLVKQKRINPHIPVWDKSARDDGTFSRSDFRFDKKRNIYVCPAGKLLRSTGTIHDGHTLRYRASLDDCRSCPLKATCSPNAPSRYISRDVHEDARDVARRKMTTKAFLKSRDERKRVEMRFAHLKTHHGFERLRLRGLSGARDEFHLAAIVQNLKTMALRLLKPPEPVRV